MYWENEDHATVWSARAAVLLSGVALRLSARGTRENRGSETLFLTVKTTGVSPVVFTIENAVPSQLFTLSPRARRVHPLTHHSDAILRLVAGGADGVTNGNSWW